MSITTDNFEKFLQTEFGADEQMAETLAGFIDSCESGEQRNDGKIDLSDPRGFIAAALHAHVPGYTLPPHSTLVSTYNAYVLRHSTTPQTRNPNLMANPDTTPTPLVESVFGNSHSLALVASVTKGHNLVANAVAESVHTEFAKGFSTAWDLLSESFEQTYFKLFFAFAENLLEAHLGAVQGLTNALITLGVLPESAKVLAQEMAEDFLKIVEEAKFKAEFQKIQMAWILARNQRQSFVDFLNSKNANGVFYKDQLHSLILKTSRNTDLGFHNTMWRYAEQIETAKQSQIENVKATRAWIINMNPAELAALVWQSAVKDPKQKQNAETLLGFSTEHFDAALAHCEMVFDLTKGRLAATYTGPMPLFGTFSTSQNAFLIATALAVKEQQAQDANNTAKFGLASLALGLSMGSIFGSALLLAAATSASLTSVQAVDEWQAYTQRNAHFTHTQGLQAAELLGTTADDVIQEDYTNHAENHAAMARLTVNAATAPLFVNANGVIGFTSDALVSGAMNATTFLAERQVYDHFGLVNPKGGSFEQSFLIGVGGAVLVGGGLRLATGASGLVSQSLPSQGPRLDATQPLPPQGLQPRLLSHEKSLPAKQNTSGEKFTPDADLPTNTKPLTGTKNSQNKVDDTKISEESLDLSGVLAATAQTASDVVTSESETPIDGIVTEPLGQDQKASPQNGLVTEPLGRGQTESPRDGLVTEPLGHDDTRVTWDGVNTLPPANDPLPTEALDTALPMAAGDSSGQRPRVVTNETPPSVEQPHLISNSSSGDDGSGSGNGENWMSPQERRRRGRPARLGDVIDNRNAPTTITSSESPSATQLPPATTDGLTIRVGMKVRIKDNGGRVWTVVEIDSYGRITLSRGDETMVATPPTLEGLPGLMGALPDRSVREIKPKNPKPKLQHQSESDSPWLAIVKSAMGGTPAEPTPPPPYTPQQHKPTSDASGENESSTPRSFWDSFLRKIGWRKPKPQDKDLRPHFENLEAMRTEAHAQGFAMPETVVVHQDTAYHFLSVEPTDTGYRYTVSENPDGSNPFTFEENFPIPLHARTRAWHNGEGPFYVFSIARPSPAGDNTLYLTLRTSPNPEIAGEGRNVDLNDPALRIESRDGHPIASNTEDAEPAEQFDKPVTEAETTNPDDDDFFVFPTAIDAPPHAQPAQETPYDFDFTNRTLYIPDGNGGFLEVTTVSAFVQNRGTFRLAGVDYVVFRRPEHTPEIYGAQNYCGGADNPDNTYAMIRIDHPGLLVDTTSHD